MANMKTKSELIKDKRILYLSLEGFFEVDKTKEAVERLKTTLKSFSTKEYSLVIDCSSMLVFKPEMLPVLTECYNLYQSAGFRHVVFIVTNVSVNMQLKRIARSVEGFLPEFVDTKEESFKICEK